MIAMEEWIALLGLDVLNQNANGKEASQPTFVGYLPHTCIVWEPTDRSQVLALKGVKYPSTRRHDP